MTTEELRKLVRMKAQNYIQKKVVQNNTGYFTGKDVYDAFIDGFTEGGIAASLDIMTNAVGVKQNMMNN